jgi:probable DNA repair protein
MDDEEAIGAVFDCLWVCGMTDEWPRRSRPNPYLPIALQRAAGVPGLTTSEQHASATAAIARFTASAPQVILSWPRQDREQEFRPNRLLLAFDAANPAEVCGPAAATCASIERGTVLEYLDDHLAPAADPALLPHRGTEVLKYQAHCPFRAFAELRLGARKLESPQLGLDRRVRGGLVEVALEEFWNQVRDSVNLSDLLSKRQVADIIDASIDKAFAHHWPEVESAWGERLRGLERQRLRALLENWCEMETDRAPFDVMLDEQQKKIEVQLGPVKMSARIDRVDRVRGGGFVVVDYKSGRTPPNPRDWDSDRPEEPQIPVYVVHQLDQGREVDGLAFAHVSSAKPAWRGYGRTKAVLGLASDNLKRYLNGESFDAHVRRWRPTLERLAGEFAAGEAAVDPKHPPTGSTSTCDRCHLHALCRVAEVSFAATDDEADAGGDDE